MTGHAAADGPVGLGEVSDEQEAGYEENEVGGHVPSEQDRDPLQGVGVRRRFARSITLMGKLIL